MSDGFQRINTIGSSGFTPEVVLNNVQADKPVHCIVIYVKPDGGLTVQTSAMQLSDIVYFMSWFQSKISETLRSL